MTRWGKKMKARQLAGLCRFCGKPRQNPLAGLCDKHMKIRRAHDIKRRRAKAAAGLCSAGRCTNVLFDSWLCETHAAGQRAAEKRYYKKRRKKKC